MKKLLILLSFLPIVCISAIITPVWDITNPYNPENTITNAFNKCDNNFDYLIGEIFTPDWSLWSENSSNALEAVNADTLDNFHATNFVTSTAPYMYSGATIQYLNSLCRLTFFNDKSTDQYAYLIFEDGTDPTKKNFVIQNDIGDIILDTTRTCGIEANEFSVETANDVSVLAGADILLESSSGAIELDSDTTIRLNTQDNSGIGVSNEKIIELADPVDPTDAVNLRYLTNITDNINTAYSEVANVATNALSLDAGGQSANISGADVTISSFGVIEMSSGISKTIDVNSCRIADLADPVSPTDAVNLRYLTNITDNINTAYSEVANIATNAFGIDSENDVDIISDNDVGISGDTFNIEAQSTSIIKTAGPLTISSTIFGAIDFDGTRLIDLAEPTDQQDGATYNFVTNEIANADIEYAEVSNISTNALGLDAGVSTVIITGGDIDIESTGPIQLESTAAGYINVNDNKITNLSDPTSAQDGATLNYVTNEIANIDKVDVSTAVGGVLYSPTTSADDLYFNTDLIRSYTNPSRISSYLTNAYTTPNLTADTWTKVVFDDIIFNDIQDFSQDVINDRYFLDTTGVTNRNFRIISTASISGGTFNSLADFAVYKNGTMIPGAKISRYLSANADVGAIALIGTFTLTDNDYLELYVRFSASDTITFENVTIIISEGF